MKVTSQKALFSNKKNNPILSPIHIISAREGVSEEKMVAEYKNLPNVEWAVVDAPVHLFSNDSLYYQQWALYNAGDVNNDIDANQAWAITQGSSNITLAVIDSGMDRDHPDLSPNVFKNPGEIEGNNIDDDANGYIDDVYGWNFLQNNNDTFDTDSHGTHVSGIIAAKINNGIGVAGVTQSKILPLRIFTDGKVDEYTSDVLRAIQYVADNAQRFNIKAVNMSFGATRARTDENASDVCVTYEPVLKNLYSKGVTAVASAGNGYAPTYLSPSEGIPFYNLAPAGCYGVISVGSTSPDDSLVSFSNYGTNMTLSAPGSSVNPGIVSTCLGSSYCEKIGTSMAAPYVVGTLGLMYSVNPNLNNWTSRAILSNPNTYGINDRVTNSTPTHYAGAGRLNAYNSVVAAQSAPAAIEPTTMTVRDADMTVSFFPVNIYNMQITVKVAVRDEGTNKSIIGSDVVISVRTPDGQTKVLSGFTEIQDPNDTSKWNAVMSSVFNTGTQNGLQGNYVITIVSVAGSTNAYHPTLTTKTCSSSGSCTSTTPSQPTPTRTPTPASLSPTPTTSIPTPTTSMSSCSDAAPVAGSILVSQGKTATASSTASDPNNSFLPAKALDGLTNTTWNSGGVAPQWIEVDLGQLRSISDLQLIVNQSPNGRTVHQIYMGSNSSPTTLVRTLDCTTNWGQTLNVHFANPQTNIRYIRVLTTVSPSWVAWFEIKAYSSSAVGPTSTPSPTLTLSTPTPYTLSPTPSPTRTPTSTPWRRF